MTQQAGSVGKGNCWQTDFDPQNPHDKRRDTTSHKLASGLLHMYTVAPVNPHIRAK